MKKLAKVVLMLAVAVLTALGLFACTDTGEDPNNGENPGKDVYSSPVITVEPDEMEITQGDEVSLLYGVTVTDEYDSDLRAIVSDDGGFDADTVGTYTVTYSATNSHNMTGTATRIYNVVAPLPNIVITAQQENDANWVENGGAEGKLSFAHELYFELTEDTTYEAATSGVFHNTSDEPIVVTVPGGYGEAAILNAAGVVIEARDGANGRLVNTDNPVRTSSQATSFEYDGETYQVANYYASYMQIPAGGFAIVAVNAGGNFDQDGRGWLNKNVVYRLGAAVQIGFDGEEDLLTVYEDQAPVIQSKADLSVRVGDSSVTISEAILEGITYIDDNGTWETDDDVTSGLTITVGTSTPEYDVGTEGEYVFSLTIADEQGNETQFTRTVVVTPAEPTMKTIDIDGTWYEFEDDQIAVNPETGATSYNVIIYTSYFTGTYFVNNYGVYFIVGADGIIRESYSPWSNTINTPDEDGVAVSTTGSQNDVLAQASELSAGEYLVLAVNGYSGSDSFRTSLQTPMSASSNYMLGMEVELWLLDIWPTFTATKEDGTSTSFSGNKVVINEVVSESDAAAADFLVYTYDWKAAGNASITCNGSGAAVVINAETGKIVRIYDGANGRLHDEDHYWDAENNSLPMADAGFTQDTYAAVAFNSLTEGEILIIFPNDGANGTDSPRTFALTLRQRFLQYTITLSNFSTEYEEEGAQPTGIRVGNALLELDPAEVAVDVDAATTADYAVFIYNYGFSGTLVSNGYGVAAVVDASGKIVRVYDGANGRYRDAENPSGIVDATKCTSAGYVSEAFASLQEGEYMIVFPNDGGENVARAWALNNARTVGAEVTLFLEAEETPEEGGSEVAPEEETEQA